MSDDLLARAAAAASLGKFGSVASLFATTKPDLLSESERVQWRLLLLEAGEETLAGTLGRSAVEETTVDSAIVDEPRDADPDDLDEELRGSDQRAQDRDGAELFLRWFGGRRDLYARQWFDERRRRGGYRPVREPLTVDVALRHLAGHITLGQYLLFPDRSVAYGVLDLDLDASVLAEHRAQHGDVAPSSHPVLRSYLARILEAGTRLGLPLFPADSGGKGAHVWIFFEPRRSAAAARSVLQQVLAAAGPPPPTLGVEVFPKQEREGPRGLSSLVKLPLGVHQGTAARCPLLDERLAPIDNSAAGLARLIAAPNEHVDAVVGRQLVALPAPELIVPELAPEAPSTNPSSPRSLGQALREIEAGKAERDAVDRVLESCSALRAIVSEAYDARRLSAEAARAIAYSIGLVSSEPEVARSVLRAANVGLKELERTRTGLASPVGCRRLRGLSTQAPPNSGQGCSSCPSGVAPYPTPMLFAVNLAPGTRPRANTDSWLTATEKVLETPLEGVARSLDDINARLGRVEQRLDTTTTPPQPDEP